MELPDLSDGIYFSLPDEVYHSLPRLGSSGVCDMLVSPATFWAGSWLNPDSSEQRAARALRTIAALDDPPDWLCAYGVALKKMHPHARPEDEESTKAQMLGKAYHAARLEGIDALESRFARQPERDDFPASEGDYQTLWTGTDIANKLAEMGEPKSKAGESVADKGRRLAALGYPGVIFPVEVAEFEESLGGRTPIPGALWDQLIRDVERIRQSPEVSRLLEGGFAEVSVLWTGPGGIRCKVRFDYLRPDSWADFKTFDNSRRRPLLQALTDAFRFNRHYVQAGFYREGADALRLGGLPIVGEASDAQRKLVAGLALRPDDLDCWYVYQEKGAAPNILARRVRFFDVPMNAKLGHAGASDEAIARVEEASRTETLFYQRAKAEIRAARLTLERHKEIYRPGEPWLPVNALGEFSDDDFPAFWLDERIQA
jgi:hypothetical protein